MRDGMYRACAPASITATRSSFVCLFRCYASRYTVNMTVIESRGLTGILRKTGSHREAVYEEGLRSARQDRYDVREYKACRK